MLLLWCCCWGCCCCGAAQPRLQQAGSAKGVNMNGEISATIREKIDPALQAVPKQMLNSSLCERGDIGASVDDTSG